MEREQIISQFSEITIDMDYKLCIPSVHAIYLNESAVIDFNGKVRHRSSGFPDQKIILLQNWISKHKDEIYSNHQKCNLKEFPLDPIKPA